MSPQSTAGLSGRRSSAVTGAESDAKTMIGKISFRFGEAIHIQVILHPLTVTEASTWLRRVSAPPGDANSGSQPA